MPLSRWSFPCKGNKSLIRNWRRVKTSINVQSWSWHRLKRLFPFALLTKPKLQSWETRSTVKGTFYPSTTFHGTMLSGWVTKTWLNRRLGWPGSAACGLGKAWSKKQSRLLSGKLSQRGQMINLVKKKARKGFFPSNVDGAVSLTKKDNRHSLLSSDVRTLPNAPRLGQMKFNDWKWFKRKTNQSKGIKCCVTVLTWNSPALNVMLALRQNRYPKTEE